MSKSQLFRTTQATGTVRALLVTAALPLLLLTAACSGESSPSPAGSSSSSTNLDGLGYSGGEEPAPEVKAAAEKALAAAAQTPENEPATPQSARTEATKDTPAGHSADDGHDHGNEPRTADLGVDEVARPKNVGHDEGPRLSYDLGREKHEFGRLMEGTVAEHTFELTNTGNEDLIIKQVKPTCGCTVAEVYSEADSGEMERYTFGNPIAPGRKIHFPAKLHTKNKSGHSNTRINIFSNDPRGTIQLGLVADIDPFFNIAPRFLNFGQVQVGEQVVKKATISTSKGQALKLEFVEQSMPAGSVVELTPLSPDAEGRAPRWDLTVTIGPDLDEGSLARSLVIKSDEPIPGADINVDGSASTYQATITLSAQVVGPFSYSPPYLSMGLVRPGQVQVRTVQIECHDPEFSFAETAPVVRVVGLQNPGTDTFRDWEYADKFTPTVRPVEGKNAIDVELRLEGMPNDATGSFRGTLLIELGHKDKKQIALVITGVCRGGPASSKPGGSK